MLELAGLRENTVQRNPGRTVKAGSRMTLTRVNSVHAQDGACDISEKVTCNYYMLVAKAARPLAQARARCAARAELVGARAISCVVRATRPGDWPDTLQALVRTFGQPEASVRGTLVPILPKGVARHKLQGGQPGNVAGLGGCTHVIQ